MSLKEQQAHETSEPSKVDEEDMPLTTKLAMICTAWVATALAVGLGFVVLSDVFLSLV